jgi:hypothetical protein
MDKLMRRRAAPLIQSGADSAVAHPRSEGGEFAGCTVLAAARLRASGTEIIVMGPGRRKLPN